MRRLYVLFPVLLVFLAACNMPRREGVSVPDPTLSLSIPTPTLGGLPTGPNPGDEVPPAVSGLVTGDIETPYLGIHLSDYRSHEQLAYFENSGARWSRFDRFYWDMIEPVPQTPAVYDWNSVDESGLAQATERGIDTIGIILFAPPYAQKNPGSVCGPIAEDQLERFSGFLNALVTRYSQPPFNVKYWEIGNEPDVYFAVPNRDGFGCWGDPNDPYFGGGYYAQMLKFAYPMIKAADPLAEVLIGGLLLDCDPRFPPETSPGSGEFKDCTPALFLEGILENGGADFFDGISFHAYDYYAFGEGKYSNSNWHSQSETNGPVSIPKASYLLERLDVHGVTGKYLLNTESAVICGRDGTDPGCQTEEFSRTKAAYTVHSNTIAFQLGLRANIWYSLTGWRASELLDNSYTPLPAYFAYRFNANILANAAFERQILDYPHMFIYEFDTGSGMIWILWSRSGETESVLLPAVPMDIFDMYGNSINSTQEVSTNYAPLYIVFNNQ